MGGVLVHHVLLCLSAPSHASLHSSTHDESRRVLTRSLLLLLLLLLHTVSLLASHTRISSLHSWHHSGLLLHAHSTHTGLHSLHRRFHTTSHLSRLALASHHSARLLLLLHLLLWLHLASTFQCDIVLTPLYVIGANHVIHVSIEFLKLIKIEFTVLSKAKQHIFDTFLKIKVTHLLLFTCTIERDKLSTRRLLNCLRATFSARIVDYDILKYFLHFI